VTDVDVAAYPPPRHVLRDLRFATEAGPDLEARGWLELVDHLRDGTGHAHAGAVATLVDALGGGLAATAAHPDWMATADLTLHLLPRADVTTVTAHGRVVRAGRTTIVTEVALAGDDTPLGLATMTFAVLPRRDGNPVILPSEDVVGRLTMALPDSGFHVPLEEAAGVVVVDAGAGVVELPVTEYVRNSLGAVQGGMMAMLASAAADRALNAACGAAQTVVDLQITYLALARTGPVATRTTVLGASPECGTAHVELVDTGADARVTTIVRARTVRP
jgi:acyl-coenzyme A thioesterase PaaI-like protein